LVKLFKGNLKEISQFFEGNFGQNKEKKRIFWFFKVEALVSGQIEGNLKIKIPLWVSHLQNLTGF
jgi:hypothetical protein